MFNVPALFNIYFILSSCQTGWTGPQISPSDTPSSLSFHFFKLQQSLQPSILAGTEESEEGSIDWKVTEVSHFIELYWCLGIILWSGEGNKVHYTVSEESWHESWNTVLMPLSIQVKLNGPIKGYQICTENWPTIFQHLNLVYSKRPSKITCTVRHFGGNQCFVFKNKYPYSIQLLSSLQLQTWAIKLPKCG